MFVKEKPDRIKKFDWVKNATMFGVDSSSLAHNYNKKKDILVLGEGPTQGSDDTRQQLKLNILLLLQD